MRLTILMPVYNDWAAASQVIARLDTVLADSRVRANVILVDDGSTAPSPHQLVKKTLECVSSVDILRLRRNLGHQRAIAIGLTYIFDKAPCDAIVVMDSDGQDRPEDVPRLIGEFCSAGGERCVFAARTKRLETTLFKVFYRLYQVLHRALTGLGIRVGNFSIIPFQHLSALVVSSEMWNHYAAAVFKLRLPAATLAAPRGPRFSGESKMNFVSLVVHGLSAISVYGEVVGTRILLGAGATGLFLVLILGGVVGIRLFTPLAVPGWATYSSGLLLVLLSVVLATALGFLLFVLGSRNMASFLPIRDYAFYIESLKRAFPTKG
jgi:glycosyltransferase involved in cell wall biosynthesis